MNDAVHTTPRVPARLVVLSIAGLWSCYFIVATIRNSAMGGEFSWPYLSRRLLVTCASMVVTAALWPMLRAMAARPYWLQAAAVAIVALPGSVLLAAINYAAFADLDKMEAATTIKSGSGMTVRRDPSGDLFIEVPDVPEPPAPPPPLPPSRPGEAERSAPPAIPSSPPGQSKEAQGTTVSIAGDRHPKSIWEDLSDLAFGRYFLLLAWAAIYLALANAEQARAAERREGEFRRAAQAAELRSLRYQINPHFLFNTLNSLSALVLAGRNEAAERMIQTLSAFYRRSLVGDPTGDLPLAEELALQKLYLEIEAVRFPERLHVSIDVPDELADVLVPGMILQPLIENSVKYGVAASRQPVTISVVAAAEGDMLVLTVADDGAGAKADSSKAAGCGIGLANVRDRLIARFGQEASLSAEALPPIGHRTVIRLPLQRDHG